MNSGVTHVPFRTILVSSAIRENEQPSLVYKATCRHTNHLRITLFVSKPTRTTHREKESPERQYAVEWECNRNRKLKGLIMAHGTISATRSVQDFAESHVGRNHFNLTESAQCIQPSNLLRLSNKRLHGVSLDAYRTEPVST